MTIDWYYKGQPLEEAVITYDGATHTVYAETGNNAEGETATLIYANHQKRNAGLYTATATLSAEDAVNYAFDQAGGHTAQTEWRIYQRKITAQDVDWGQTSFEYDNTLKTVTASITNMVAGDQIEIVYVNEENITNQAVNKGSYLAQIDYIINDNYYLDGTISAQWHITPKLLTVSWTTGSYTYNASLRGITLTISGIIPDDSIIVNVTTTGIYPSWGESQLVYDGGNGELKQTFWSGGGGKLYRRGNKFGRLQQRQRKLRLARQRRKLDHKTKPSSA